MRLNAPVSGAPVTALTTNPVTLPNSFRLTTASVVSPLCLPLNSTRNGVARLVGKLAGSTKLICRCRRNPGSGR